MTATKFKIYREPGVALVGKQEMIPEGIVKFLTDHDIEWSAVKDREANAAHDIPEMAGRLCYMSFGPKEGRKDAAYIEHIIKVKHGSVLEHVYFNWLVYGISRSLSHEWVRHRAGWAYSQLSQRYVDSGEAALVMPPEILELPENMRGEIERLEIEHFDESVRKYEYLTTKLADHFASPEKLFDFLTLQESLTEIMDPADMQTKYTGKGNTDTKEVWLTHLANNAEIKEWAKKATLTARRKAARSTARSVLPNATETKVFGSANARALRHFLEMRGSPAADVEIRRVAVAFLAELKKQAPWLFGDYEVRETGDGVGCIWTPYPKV